MAFFRNESITDVVRRLNLSADGKAGMNLLARSAWGRPGGMDLPTDRPDIGRGTLPEVWLARSATFCH